MADANLITDLYRIKQAQAVPVRKIRPVNTQNIGALNIITGLMVYVAFIFLICEGIIQHIQ